MTPPKAAARKPKKKGPPHLWEVEHAYYCNEENYYAGSKTVGEFNSWESFLADEGDADLDYNLVFRWDWDKTEKTLKLFFMGQRKGLFRTAIIRGMHPDEEASVRQYLETRWKHLSDLWAPISLVTPRAKKARNR